MPPPSFEFLNSFYALSLSIKMLEHVEIFNNDPTRPQATNAINNVYDMPSIEVAVRYLHSVVGLPPTETWLKAIRNGNYLTWLLIIVKMSISRGDLKRSHAQPTPGPIIHQEQGTSTRGSGKTK